MTESKDNHDEMIYQQQQLDSSHDKAGVAKPIWLNEVNLLAILDHMKFIKEV